MMFLRRIKKTENAAKEKLGLLQQNHQALEESLIAAFAQVLDHAGVEQSSDACFGQDESQLKALQFLKNYRLTRREFLPFDIDLSFASERWKKFVSSRDNESQMLDRRALEVCVFWHVAEELHVANLYVEGSGEYQDYRTQLLPWEECERRLPAYCAALGLPETPQAIVAALREELETVAAQVDAGFPDNTQLSIDPDGKPHLKRQKKAIPAENLEAFQKEVRSRLPERHLLDILKHTYHWTGYTRHFGPPSGSSTKMSEPTLRYLFTLFG